MDKAIWRASSMNRGEEAVGSTVGVFPSWFWHRDECEHFQKGFMGWVKIILKAKLGKNESFCYLISVF